MKLTEKKLEEAVELFAQGGARSTVQESVKNHYETILTRSISLMEQEIEKIATQLQTLETAIAAAKVKIPEIEKDYLVMLKMQDTLNLRLLKITDQLTDRLLERLRAITLWKLNATTAVWQRADGDML